MIKKLTDEELRKLQLTELEILVEIDRICSENGLRYMISNGTLLGAVRHKGFIPWDDDVDVSMLRSDYEKFRKACKTKLDKSRFYFQDDRNTKGYRWGYGKIRRKGTEYIRPYQEKLGYPQGIFVDIFPFDYVPEENILRTVKNFECFVIRKILWSKVGQYADPSPLKRRIYSMLALIPEKDVKRYLHGMVRRSAKDRGSQMVRILTYNTFTKLYGYMRDWFEHEADYEFEGHVFKGVKEYESYLDHLYGDYMKLPPPEKRGPAVAESLKLSG